MLIVGEKLKKYRYKYLKGIKLILFIIPLEDNHF